MRRCHAHHLLLAAVACACTLGAPAAADARQRNAEMRLVLLDGATGTPIAAARAMVQPRGGTHVAVDGVVTLRGLALGKHVVTIVAGGYAEWRDTLHVTRPGTGEATIRLQPSAIRLDPITAEAARRSYLERVGFDSRRGSAFGHFIERPEIARRDPIDLLDMLGGSTRGEVVDDRGRRRFMLRHAGQRCDPALWMDGVRAVDPYLLETIDPADVDAIEIYSGGVGTPIEWRRDACGALLIWTRSGRGRD